MVAYITNFHVTITAILDLLVSIKKLEIEFFHEHLRESLAKVTLQQFRPAGNQRCAAVKRVA